MSTITVRRDDTVATRHTLRIRGHEVVVDASVPEGGEDVGPQPHDLYDGALAACKALTVLLYARRKQMPIEEIEVTMFRDDSQERQGIYRLKAALRLTGGLSDQQREELLTVAGKCPVHKLMTKVVTEVETVWG